MNIVSIIFWVYITGVLTTIPVMAEFMQRFMAKSGYFYTFKDCVISTLKNPHGYMFLSWWGVYKILTQK
tara:strand:+ start:241 stop:447 length:207 start_codon:yes stop_codon:yes gene_type:complete